MGDSGGRSSDESRLRTDLLRLKGALYDPNTGLHGTPAVMETVRALFQRTRSVGIVHIEIDPASRVEAVYGWQVLDDLLKVLSSDLQALRPAFPADAVICQAGICADRFLVFLPVARNTSQAAVTDIVGAVEERLRLRLEDDAYRSMTPSPSLNVGHAIVAEHPFYRLERQIYRGIDDARASGRREENRARGREQMELKRIMREQQIETLFQPIVNLENGEIMGYEAFSRGPRRTAFERPDSLFESSREAGMAGELDRLCQRAAIRKARHIRKGTKLFLNALPHSLLDPGFREGLLADLPEDYTIRREDIVLEIADRNAIDDYEAFGAEVDDLRASGFLMSIDDVGKGTTSLESLSEVRPDYIKIDISLIRNIHNNLIKQELLRSLCHVARAMNAEIIAEGIETQEELDIAKECGARLGQGYLFFRPSREIPVQGAARQRTEM